MDKYHFFSFVFNKLNIMHDFTNLHHFSLQDIFQIEDLVIKCANLEIRWNKKWQFCIEWFE